MSFEEVYGVVCDRMQESLVAELGIDPFSFSMKPSKPRPEGLGFSLENTWWLHLLVLQEEYLPKEEPYTNPEFNTTIASAIYNKELAEGCYDLTIYLLDS